MHMKLQNFEVHLQVDVFLLFGMEKIIIFCAPESIRFYPLERRKSYSFRTLDKFSFIDSRSIPLDLVECT